MQPGATGCNIDMDGEGILACDWALGDQVLFCWRFCEQNSMWDVVIDIDRERCSLETLDFCSRQGLPSTATDEETTAVELSLGACVGGDGHASPVPLVSPAGEHHGVLQRTCSEG